MYDKKEKNILLYDNIIAYILKSIIYKINKYF